MKPKTVKHFTFATPALSTCPVCRAKRGVVRGVFVQHYGKVDFVQYTRRQRKTPYCAGSGMKAATVSTEGTQ